MSFFFLIQNGGIATEKSYPYEGVDGTCRNGARGATISNYTMISSNEDQMAAYLVEHGPLSIAAAAGTDTQQLRRAATRILTLYTLFWQMNGSFTCLECSICPSVAHNWTTESSLSAMERKWTSLDTRFSFGSSRTVGAAPGERRATSGLSKALVNVASTSMSPQPSSSLNFSPLWIVSCFFNISFLIQLLSTETNNRGVNSF